MINTSLWCLYLHKGSVFSGISTNKKYINLFPHSLGFNDRCMKTKQSEIICFCTFHYSSMKFTLFTKLCNTHKDTTTRVSKAWRWNKFIYFLFVLIPEKTLPLCKYKHHKDVFIIINMIKICHNFLHIRKNIESGEKATPNKKVMLSWKRKN
jgi:hypothetical protein